VRPAFAALGPAPQLAALVDVLAGRLGLAPGPASAVMLPPGAVAFAPSGVGGSAPIAKPPAASFDSFLGEIGGAMVAAQHALDRESLSYTADAGPLGVPTSFRIPKLSASMRFGLEKRTDRGFDLLIYSSTESARELNQQSLDLEIVAVPADPRLAAAADGGRTRLSLLAAAAARAPLLAAFQADLAHDPAADLAAVRAAPARVVFIAAPPRPAGASASVEDVLVLFTTPDPNGSAGAWYMTRMNGTPQDGAEALVPYGPATDASVQRMLHNLADELCRGQAALLAPG
jgi:hypothetical protein